MTTPTKIIMRWNIRPGSESEYFEFMVNEFIPGFRRLGIVDPQVWYTVFGDREQILVSGISETDDHMRYLLRSQEWVDLKDRLTDLVDNYSQNVIPATGGFQL
jgi:hypothetical protein